MFRLWPPRSGARLLAVLTLLLAVVLDICPLRAEKTDQPIQLEVILNGTPTQLIGGFVLLKDGQMAASRQELEEIGISPRGYASPAELVVLDNLSGLSYRYEESSQRIFITAPEEMRVRKEYKASNSQQEPLDVQTDYGGVLNYTLFASAPSNPGSRLVRFNGASATLDGRAFTPFGTFSQSAILRASIDDRFDALRLNTSFAYSDHESLTTYRAGDTITGGLAWTRPIRIGGAQVARNFGLRPDLVTLPLPSAEGSALVPSTADVYINNIKTFSQDIGSGPYRLSNLPAVSGSGNARVVLRDASGRETETSLPFYASASLLAPGLLDYSLEAGLPRLSYGTPSDIYVAKPVGAGSVRYGLFDWLTVAGHFEGGAGLLNGSAGIMARTGSFGVASFAAAASHYAKGTGYQSYLSYETKIFGINISASSQMTFGAYDDLASVTARLHQSTDPLGLSSLMDITSSINANATSLFTSARPPKALNRVSIGIPLPIDKASLSATFIQSNDAAGERSSIATATLTFGLPYDIAFFATAFTTLAGEKNTGVLAGLSMRLGDTATGSISASSGRGGSSINVDAVKPLDVKPGSFGWRVRDSEGSAPQRAAAVAYRSSYFRTEAGVSQDRNGSLVTADVEGAIATLGGGVFFANRIDDAFAVIETGVPGVEVFHENRAVAITNSTGRALVPGLRSYQRNKIAIDTSTLPVDADVSITEKIVAPADRSGMLINLAVNTSARPAIVGFTTATGAPLAAGSRGQVEGGESFVVGYDGQAYIKNLSPENKVTVQTLDRECRASFDYAPRPNEQVVISPVICR